MFHGATNSFVNTICVISTARPSANSQAARAFSTSMAFSPTLISSGKWQGGAMPARSQCFSNKLLKFCTKESFKNGEFAKRRIGPRLQGVVGEKKIEEKEKDGSDLNNALRVYPSFDCSCLWTFDNSENQLSRISYPLCVCSNPRDCRLLSDDRSAMAFNEISCVLYLHFFLLFAYILYKCISTFCLASV